MQFVIENMDKGALSRKHEEQRMPIDRQGDYAEEGYCRRAEIVIRNVLA